MAELRPEQFKTLDCTLPVDNKGGTVHLVLDGGGAAMETNRASGVLAWGGRQYALRLGKPFAVT